MEKSRRKRVNMRIPEELLDWAKGYSQAKHTSVTQLFVDRLVELKAQESKDAAAA